MYTLRIIHAITKHKKYNINQNNYVDLIIK